PATGRPGALRQRPRRRRRTTAPGSWAGRETGSSSASPGYVRIYELLVVGWCELHPELAQRALDVRCHRFGGRELVERVTHRRATDPHRMAPADISHINVYEHRPIRRR